MEFRYQRTPSEAFLELARLSSCSNQVMESELERRRRVVSYGGAISADWGDIA